MQPILPTKYHAAVAEYPPRGSHLGVPMWIRDQWWEMDELDRAVEATVLELAVEGDTQISDVFIYYRGALSAVDEDKVVARCERLVRSLHQRGLITVFTSTADKQEWTYTDLEGPALDAALTDPKNWDPKRGIPPDAVWMLATKKGECYRYSPDS